MHIFYNNYVLNSTTLEDNKQKDSASVKTLEMTLAAFQRFDNSPILLQDNA